MLPMSEFHFAFCGIATVAATLGYACARRAALTLASANESKADVEAGPPEEKSLKRKLDDSDDGESDQEEQSRPMKRSRTPPTDQRESDEDEWEVIVAPPTYEEAVCPQQPFEAVQQDNAPTQEDVPSQRLATPIRETTPPPIVAVPAYSEQPVTGQEPLSTPPSSRPNLTPTEPEAQSKTPATPPPKPAAPTTPRPTNPFSAFASSSSPFASYSSGTGASSFGLVGEVVKSTPAWRRGKEKAADVFAETSSGNALAPSPNDALTSTTGKSSLALPRNTDDTGAANQTQALTKSSSHVTGEEEETVIAELKGAKLFIKRGRKDFTDGMYGHIKILSQASPSSPSDEGETQAKPRTRILFRRDPLGQVSMNVGLHPTVRCHFDEAENILRIIHMEQISKDGQESKEDVVIYALKPGRSPKPDFQCFAKSLCDNEELKSKPVVAVTSTSTVDAAAP
ncbi:hypothetical protein HYDPIDRAFT_27465 [Hydnomerulius pinastri MD-312]|nr:hypothetical protein HYDPIDRAFT_27465 [Hydnomerulius pinastri MD-312]